MKALRDLGPVRSLAYLAYRVLKQSGAYRLWKPPRPHPSVSLGVRPDFSGVEVRVPADDPARGRVEALLAGRVTLFGAVGAALDFSLPSPPEHWTHYDRGRLEGQDIKFVWEPARFGWVCDLLRVYAADGDAGLPVFLAQRWADFIRQNPPYRGPQWASGQEVALRLIHLVFADAVLGGAVPDMAQVAAVHATRIPPTLLYARAQDNNHLLAEAAGLFTAGVFYPEHPRSRRWQQVGWRAFNRAVLRQFTPAGEYVQQSANYHRLVLQLAVWTAFAGRQAGKAFPQETAARLAAGTRWLLDLCDPATGCVPNLGPNDGADILPMTSLPFEDFRPTLQVAARAFLGAPAFPPGPWDESGEWFRAEEIGAHRSVRSNAGPAGMIRIVHPETGSRAFLRAARFRQRPGHADQLHVDLWRGGRNIALDPGTYSYNAGPPWDNALQTAGHHNTLTVDGLDQMTRAGRFLYVDRAQAVVVESGPDRVSAEHDGYRRLGLVHRRTLAAVPGGWRITDRINGAAGRRRVRIHWLLPDLPWRLDETRLEVEPPEGPLSLEIVFPDGLPFEIALVRAGMALIGPAPAPTMGWHSPTYGVKEPALSFAITILVETPAALESVWRFR